jgi:hypothetical protein
MSEDFVKVHLNDSKKKSVEVKNVEPVSNIKIIRDREPSISSVSSDDSSSVSESSEESVKKKKTKKVLRRKENVEHNYSAFSNPKKVKPYESESESEYTSEDSYSERSYQSDEQETTWEDKQKLKQDLLIKIQALEKKGFEFSKKFTMSSSLEEMDFEYQKVKKYLETQSGIKFARRCLMACVTGIEFLNKKFDPFNIKLEGWSENVMENVDDYDNIFEKLHEKYASKAEIAPEIELLLTLGGSAFMFHLTNSLLKGPTMGNVIAQNNPNFMASMMGAMSQGMKEMARPPNFKQPQPQQQQQPQQQGFPQPVQTRGIRQEMASNMIDPNLFKGTPLASNHPSSTFQQKPVYYQESIDDDDRYSIASSDSSLSSVSIESTIKNVNVVKKGKGKGGLELNIK